MKTETEASAQMGSTLPNRPNPMVKSVLCITFMVLSAIVSFYVVSFLESRAGYKDLVGKQTGDPEIWLGLGMAVFSHKLVMPRSYLLGSLLSGFGLGAAIIGIFWLLLRSSIVS